MNISIAIDGPAGAGKSTISKLLALKFGLQYVDTGAMYRGVALLALRQGISDIHDESRLAAIARDADFQFKMEKENDAIMNRVFLNGEDVTDAIRVEEVTRFSSPVSAVSGVRRELVAKQKQMGARGGVVMEGRDISTVVLTHAEVKIFLTASETERARRRQLDLAASGAPPPLKDVVRALRERDTRDSTRADSPLVQAPDAVLVDTDNKSIDEVVDEISSIVTRHLNSARINTDSHGKGR
ncbi:MAG: (d)CMP kinase [bacterium]